MFAIDFQGQKLSRDERIAKVHEILELIKLSGYGTRRAHEISGDQRQRVALARALILQPRALLLDEPLGAFDKQLREQTQRELRALQKSIGITFVHVTHDQEEALTLSDKIALMSAGQVLQIDTPAGLCENPTNRKVARFIGNLNFFSGKVIDTSAATAKVETEGLGNLLIKANAMRQAKGAAVLLAIRPEKLILCLEKSATGATWWLTGFSPPHTWANVGSSSSR